MVSSGLHRSLSQLISSGLCVLTSVRLLYQITLLRQDRGSSTSKLKIFNKNYKGLGTTEKGKKQEETQTGR